MIATLLALTSRQHILGLLIHVAVLGPNLLDFCWLNLLSVMKKPQGGTYGYRVSSLPFHQSLRFQALQQVRG
jgi:hypothetical protein